MEVPKVSWSRLPHTFCRREEMRSRLCKRTLAPSPCPGVHASLILSMTTKLNPPNKAVVGALKPHQRARTR